MNAIEQAIEALQAARMELTGYRIETKLADAEAALQSMQGEAVAEVVSKYGDPEAFGEREVKLLADIQKLPYGTKLYTPPAQPKVPDRAALIELLTATSKQSEGVTADLIIALLSAQEQEQVE